MPEKVLILKSGSCSWGKCIFCGYGRIAGKKATFANLKKDFDRLFQSLEGADSIKVFGSGSFLDARQVPEDARKYFIEKCTSSGVKKLLIESRPEYIDASALKEFLGLELTVAIGLEAADDQILDKIKKGFHLKDYEDAANTIHACSGKVRTYLIVNLPYVKDAVKALDSSVEYALKHSDSIVLINLLPHGNTPVYKMWLRGEWNYLSKEEFYETTKKWKNDPRIDLDAETFRFVPKFPEEAKEPLKGVGEEFLTHPHFEVWQDFLQRWYKPKEEKDMLLFLSCSYKKPYSESETHKRIIETLMKTKAYPRIHQMMLSNAGVIPREFENNYPFNAYDWDESLETEEIKRRYIEVTARRIKKYLSAHRNNYKKVYCFLKYSQESYTALKNACGDLGIPFKNLLTEEDYRKIKDAGKPLQNQIALDDLFRGIENENNPGN